MTPEARSEMLARAERALRRGELGDAESFFEALCRAFPEDHALALKLANLREALQPQERQSIRDAEISALPTSIPQGPSSPVNEGERLFALGDYAGAAAAYRRALQERPNSELIRERLEELYQMACELPSHSPTDRSLPRQAEPLLHALLDRLAARRRLKRD